MKKAILMLMVVVGLTTVALSDPVRNFDLQAVNATGGGTHPSITSGEKIIIEGYILNRPEYMCNGTPNYNEITGNIGGEWQIYIQDIQNSEPNQGGTAIWMGQNYANRPLSGGVGRYTNEEWISELDRLSYDDHTGHKFMPGDKVRVTGLTKFYGGKTNINERHNTTIENDFIIELVELGAGLPEPVVVTLDMLVSDTNAFYFDQTRQTGCEKYQARLVRINDVNFVNPNLWAPNATLSIRDNTGRTFPLKLGIGPGITTTSNNLLSQFDVIGIFDQEDGSAPTTDGYRIWVTNYDGNGLILTDGCDLNNEFALGDLNKDCSVNFADFAIFAEDWLKNTNTLLIVTN